MVHIIGMLLRRNIFGYSRGVQSYEFLLCPKVKSSYINSYVLVLYNRKRNWETDVYFSVTEWIIFIVCFALQQFYSTLLFAHYIDII